MREAADITALLGQTPAAVLPCAGGGNNRVLRVEAGGNTYLAKYYFQSAEDTRRRMENEWAFLSYAAKAGVPAVPRPIARDDDAGLAIYSFLPGRVPLPDQIDEDAVAQAGALIANLNRHKELARDLADASESCFSAPAHVALLEARMQRLAPYGDAIGTIYRDMQAAFTKCTSGLDYPPVAKAQRILSPSDFGFHNSLRDAQGRFSFIDFEYAGWDDPAKLLCDFLLHPGVSVDAALLPHLLASMESVDVDLPRARRLWPLLALRWCCIILSVFVPEHAARRRFADSAWDERAAQTKQLAKARLMLQKLPSNPF